MTMNHRKMVRDLLRTITVTGLVLSTALIGGCRPAAAAVKADAGAAEAAAEAAEEIFKGIMSGTSDQDLQALYENAEAQFQNILNEDGSLNMDAVKSAGQQFFETYVTGDASEDDALSGLFQKIDNTNAAMEKYTLERNADILRPAAVQLLAGGNVYADDYSVLKEYHVIYSAIQYNYDMDQAGCMRYVDGGNDLILFSFREEDDGSVTIVDAKLLKDETDAASAAETAAAAGATLKEVCGELNASYDEAAEMLAFNRAYDVRTLIDYMEEHPEVTGIEYEGAVRTHEELEKIEDQRLKAIFPEDFENAQ